MFLCSFYPVDGIKFKADTIIRETDVEHNLYLGKLNTSSSEKKMRAHSGRIGGLKTILRDPKLALKESFAYPMKSMLR